MATSVGLPDVDSLRPAGSKRSSKRDFIVNVFLRQEGHLSADDLVDLIRREDARISRATVYRTLQWMVDGRHRPQGRLRRGPLPLRALLPPPAALPPDLQDLQPLVRVPELGHRGADRRSGGGARLHARARAWCRSTAPARPAAPAARRSADGGNPSCSSPATRCASPSPPSAAAATSTPAPRS